MSQSVGYSSIPNNFFMIPWIVLLEIQQTDDNELSLMVSQNSTLN